MIIDIKDSRVEQAVKLAKELNPGLSSREFEKVFEQKYHCRIEIDMPQCLTGRLIISEEKYKTWFLIQFGDKIE